MSVSQAGGLVSASCGIKLGRTKQLFLHYRIVIQLLGMGLKDKCYCAGLVLQAGNS